MIRDDYKLCKFAEYLFNLQDTFKKTTSCLKHIDEDILDLLDIRKKL